MVTTVCTGVVGANAAAMGPAVTERVEGWIGLAGVLQGGKLVDWHRQRSGWQP